MCAIVCATSLIACGGADEKDEGTIPSQTGEAIVTKLGDLDSELAAGECDSAEATATQIQAAIQGLGSNVEGELEETLVKASSNLVQLVREECEPAEEPLPPEPTTGATGEEGAED